MLQAAYMHKLLTIRIMTLHHLIIRVEVLLANAPYFQLRDECLATLIEALPVEEDIERVKVRVCHRECGQVRETLIQVTILPFEISEL